MLNVNCILILYGKRKMSDGQGNVYLWAHNASNISRRACMKSYSYQISTYMSKKKQNLQSENVSWWGRMCTPDNNMFQSLAKLRHVTDNLICVTSWPVQRDRKQGRLGVPMNSGTASLHWELTLTHCYSCFSWTYQFCRALSVCFFWLWHIGKCYK